MSGKMVSAWPYDLVSPAAASWRPLREPRDSYLAHQNLRAWW
jgi:hypothetical protein